MRIERRYTKHANSPYAEIAFRTTKSEIRNPDGSLVFSADNIEVPSAWSQVAADVLAQKYFRKAGVPARLKRISAFRGSSRHRPDSAQTARKILNAKRKYQNPRDTDPKENPKLSSFSTNC